MKLCYFALAAAIVVSSGCGKEERREAVGFYKTLANTRAAWTQSNTEEKEFVEGLRGWCTGITANGGGTGTQLDQNISMAQDMAKSAAAVSALVGQVRQPVTDLRLQNEFTQGVRNPLITELTRRQRALQELRSALQETAEEFNGFRQSRGYKGDTYPAGIDKLTQLLQRYHEPPDAVADAVNALSGKYNFTSAETGT